MSGRSFLDTTIVVYSLLEEGHKSNQARELMLGGSYISVQVLNEFASVARRKFRREWNEIQDAVKIIGEACYQVHSVSMETHLSALGISQRYGFHIFDSLMIASALEQRCSVLYSEDMQHGQQIEGLEIRNPFVEA